VIKPGIIQSVEKYGLVYEEELGRGSLRVWISHGPVKLSAQQIHRMQQLAEHERLQQQSQQFYEEQERLALLQERQLREQRERKQREQQYLELQQRELQQQRAQRQRDKKKRDQKKTRAATNSAATTRAATTTRVQNVLRWHSCNICMLHMF